MKHEERQCEYEHCIEMFIPKRSDSRFCSASCRNMAGDLRRRREAEERYAQQRERWAQQQRETSSGQVSGYSQPAQQVQTVVQYVTKQSQLEKDMQRDLKKSLEHLMDKIEKRKGKEEITYAKLLELYEETLELFYNPLRKYIPKDSLINQLLDPIVKQVLYWVEGNGLKAEVLEEMDEEELESKTVKNILHDKNFFEWIENSHWKLRAAFVF